MHSTSDRRQVPFFNYPAVFAAKEKELMEVVTGVLRRGAYIMQKDLRDFEANLAKFTGAKYAFGVADGTNALILALQAAGIKAGDEVILPSHTYVATAAAVHFAGATPVLCECAKDHMIDPQSARKLVTKKTKAIMPVQLNGRTADMSAVQSLAKDFGLTIIEDAAQALGSKFKGQSAGTFGAAGTFSFYPAKLLGCFGDGGAVITNDDAMARQLSLLRDHGRDDSGEVVAWGTNSRLDNLQAAVLDCKLKTFQQDINRRRDIANRYQNGLGDVKQLLLPPAPTTNDDHYDVYQNYEIEAYHREDLRDFLKGQGIGTIVQFGGKPVHKYPLGFDGVSLPYTEAIYKRTMLVPMHTALSDEDVDYVIANIRKFYTAGGVR